MFQRALADKIPSLAGSFPVLMLTGPRQSGKTTLVRSLFPEHGYVNLENLDDRMAVEEDPVRFLRSGAETGLVIDEAQKVPALFSYLQGIVDETGLMGRYVLIGSQNFLLLEKITQSLAGRAAIGRLMPFTLDELDRAGAAPASLDDALFHGGYPPLYDRNIDPVDYFPSYIQTYIERDVRSIANLSKLGNFQRFVKLCAGRTGQLLNLSGLANDAGVDRKTVQSWLSILEASFIVFRLSPYHRDFRKRRVKQQKLYFYDTGLLCSLLDIESPRQLASHYLRGNIFECMVVSEYLKRRVHKGLRSNAWFWRDSKGHEVDLLLEQADRLTAVEIKSSETLNSELFHGLRYFQSLAGVSEEDLFLIHGGPHSRSRKYGQALSWRRLDRIMPP